MKKIRIALLSGGISGEREISLKTGEEIKKALNKSKYVIFCYDPKIDLPHFLKDALDKKFDLVFPALHGPYGEDGTLQGMLDILRIPYVFSGCLPSALAMDKSKAKAIASQAGILTPSEILISRQYNLDEIIKRLSLPLVIKPLGLGSSVGISIAKNKSEAEAGIKLALKHDSKALIEEYIEGRELTAAVLGNKNPKALPIIEIIPKLNFWFDFKAKYEPGASEEVCPADISKEAEDKIKGSALKIFQAIGCKDLARVDFIWNEKNNQAYFLEINTIPGMTKTSLAPQAAAAAGISFNKLLDILIREALDYYGLENS